MRRPGGLWLAALLLAGPVLAQEPPVIKGDDLPWYTIVSGFLISYADRVERGEPTSDLVDWPAEETGLGGIAREVADGYRERNMAALGAPSVEQAAFEALEWKFREMGRRFAAAHRHLAGHGYDLTFDQFLRRAEEHVRPRTMTVGDSDHWRDRPALEAALEEGIQEVYPEWRLPQP